MDASNGWEQVAKQFIAVRSRIGRAEVLEWSRLLPRGAAVLELGCGHGAPISVALAAEGFALHGVDASSSLIAAYRERVPTAQAEVAAVETSALFERTFDAVLAWGLLFLLTPAAQAHVIARAAEVLVPGGRFLFTAPSQACAWEDILTGRPSVSLGAAEYERLLRSHDLMLLDQWSGEGENYYYSARKTESPTDQ